MDLTELLGGPTPSRSPTPDFSDEDETDNHQNFPAQRTDAKIPEKPPPEERAIFASNPNISEGGNRKNNQSEAEFSFSSAPHRLEFPSELSKETSQVGVSEQVSKRPEVSKLESQDDSEALPNSTKESWEEERMPVNTIEPELNEAKIFHLVDTGSFQTEFIVENVSMRNTISQQNEIKEEPTLTFENFEFTAAPIELEDDVLSARGDLESADGRTSAENPDIMDQDLSFVIEPEDAKLEPIFDLCLGNSGPAKSPGISSGNVRTSDGRNDNEKSGSLDGTRKGITAEIGSCEEGKKPGDHPSDDDEIWLPRKAAKTRKRKYKFVKKIKSEPGEKGSSEESKEPATQKRMRPKKKARRKSRARKSMDSQKNKAEISKKPVTQDNSLPQPNPGPGLLDPNKIKLEVETISEGPSLSLIDTADANDDMDFAFASKEKTNPLLDPVFLALAEKNYSKAREQQPFGCEHCKKLYSKVKRLTAHLKRENGEIKCSGPWRENHAATLVCICCSIKFDSQRATQCHEMNKKGILGNSDKGSKWGRGLLSQSKKCYRCDKILAHNSSLFRHLKFVHNESRGAQFLSDDEKTKLAEKVKLEIKHDPSKGFQCSDCAKYFEDEKSRDFHNCSFRTKRSVWLTENGQYKCDQCEKRFGAPINIMNHYRIAHGKRVACECCQAMFTFHTMNIHRQSKGLPPLGKKIVVAKKRRKRKESKPLNCQFCDRSNPFYPKRLKEHVRRCHADELDRFCISCYDVLPSKEMLEHHVSTLHPDEIHCENCGKFFVDKEFFENVHKLRCKLPTRKAGSMSFVCKHCRRTYYREENLEEHVRLEHEATEKVADKTNDDKDTVS